MKHPKFEGHVTTNKDGYQKSVQLLSWSIIIHH